MSRSLHGHKEQELVKHYVRKKNHTEKLRLAPSACPECGAWQPSMLATSQGCSEYNEISTEVRVQHSHRDCLFLNPDIMICFQADPLSSAQAFSCLRAIKQADNTCPGRRDRELQAQKGAKAGCWLGELPASRFSRAHAEKHFLFPSPLASHGKIADQLVSQCLLSFAVQECGSTFIF